MTTGATTTICPCGTVTIPAVVFNPPGLSSISYRWGDYTSVRYALLQPLPGEAALSQIVGGKLLPIWRPTGEGDLALQLVEWWAYLADVLTFYCQRIATQAYLGTADQPESVSRLIQLLGYRPRPALGATGTVAALLSGTKPVTLPQGFQIQSKPAPGQQPQIFELTAATTAGVPDRLTLSVPPQAAAVMTGATTPSGQPVASLMVAGTVGGLKVGEELLLIKQGWTGQDGNWGIGTVQQFGQRKDPTGATNTSITVAMTSQGSALGSAQASGYRILRSSGTATLFQYADPSLNQTILGQDTTSPSGNTGHAVLASIFRQILVGDPIVLENPQPGAANAPIAANVTGYTEIVYYANNPLNPTTPPTQPASPPAAPPIPIPMPASKVTFATMGTVFGDPTTVVVRYGWKDLGTIIDPPAATAGGSTSSDLAGLQFTPPSGFSPTPGTPAQVIDANGNGAAGAIDQPTTVKIAAPVPSLTAPLTVLLNLLAVSRGKSVVNEVLGSGNAAILGQDFTLQNAPVTYLQDPASTSGDDYSSTVRVFVNGIQWREVRSFYGQPDSAQIFLTREDEQGKTHVVFNGRLPTGVNNVVASYRYGAGADAPAPGALSVVLQPQPGLKSVVNALAPSGGADADPPDRIKRLAPLSVMSFNRAVAVEDYQVIAGSAPGVARATAAYAFDARSQRPRVTVWVGDDQGALNAAVAALAAAADPNRPPIVRLASQRTMILSLVYLRDPQHQDAAVLAGLQSALLDPGQGLFGANVVAIGQAFYDSQIYAACLAVPGVVAIRNLNFAPPDVLPPAIAIERPILTGLSALANTAIAVDRSALVKQPAGSSLAIESPGLAGVIDRAVQAAGSALPSLTAVIARPIRFPIRPIARTPAPCTDQRYDPGQGASFSVPAANLQISGSVAS
jgi:hypothetical protein